MLQHNLKELDDNFGGGSAEDLAETSLLSVADAAEGVTQNTDADHATTGESIQTFFRVPELGQHTPVSSEKEKGRGPPKVSFKKQPGNDQSRFQNRCKVPKN